MGPRGVTFLQESHNSIVSCSINYWITFVILFYWFHDRTFGVATPIATPARTFGVATPSSVCDRPTASV